MARNVIEAVASMISYYKACTNSTKEYEPKLSPVRPTTDPASWYQPKAHRCGIRNIIDISPANGHKNIEKK
jgi:hypothetical protein